MTDEELDGFLGGSNEVEGSVSDDDLDSFLSGSSDQSYVDETERLIRRRKEIAESLSKSRCDIRGSDYLKELNDINDRLSWREGDTTDGGSRTVKFKNGVCLKDGEIYRDKDSDRTGVFYRFDYDAYTRNQDPRIPVGGSEYQKTHPVDLEKTYGVEPKSVTTEELRKNKRESEDREKTDRDSVSAMKHLEERFGRSGRSVTFNAEDISADDAKDVLNGKEYAEFEEIGSHKGNIDHKSRPIHVLRDKDGMIEGFATTKSMVIPAMDGSGSFVVIPTIKGNSHGQTVEMSSDEAAARFRETGKTYGYFDTEKDARKAAQTIDEAHQRMNAARWHQYILEHWDEMSDNIKSDPETKLDYDAWVQSGSPKATATVRDILSNVSNKTSSDAADGVSDLNPEKHERGIGEDIVASLESDTGMAVSNENELLDFLSFGMLSGDSKKVANAIGKYVTPSMVAKDKMSVQSDQSRYERYLDGTWTNDDLKNEDPKVAELIRNDPKFANIYGQDKIGSIARVKQDANRLLDSTYLPWYKKPVSGGVKNLGYTMEFVLSEALGMGITLPAVQSAVSRYGDLRQNDYDVSDDGTLVMTTEGDDAGIAGVKAVVGGVTEAVIEKYLFDNPLTKNVANAGFARNVRGRIMRGLADSKAGNMLLKTASGFGKLKKYTATNGVFEEILEEDAQAVVDDVFGVGRRADEDYNGSDTLTAKGQLEIFLDMFGTMALQAGLGLGVSHLSGVSRKSRELRERVKSIYDIPGLNKNLVDNMSDREKAKFLNFYNRYGNNPEKLNEIASRLFGVNGKLEVALRQAADRVGIRMEQGLFDRGVRAEKINIPVDESGNVLFAKRRIVDPFKGNIGVYNVAEDADHMIAIADLGNGKFEVIDQQRRGAYSFDDLDSAISFSDRLVMANQAIALDNSEKIQYATAVAEHNGVDVVFYEGRNQLEKAFGEETAKQTYDIGVGSFVNGGKVHVILDNVHTPSQMDRTISKGAGIASRVDNGSAYGADAASIVIDDEIEVPPTEGVEITGVGDSSDSQAKTPSGDVAENGAADVPSEVADAPKAVSDVPTKNATSGSSEVESPVKKGDRVTFVMGRGEARSEYSGEYAGRDPSDGKAVVKDSNGRMWVVEPNDVSLVGQSSSSTEKPTSVKTKVIEPEQKPSEKLSAKNGRDLPVDDHGVPTAEVGTKLTAEDGSEYEVVTRKDGSKKWKAVRGPKWTVDYGKTYHPGLVVGDRFSEEDYDDEKVPVKINFNHQGLKEGQVWEVEIVHKDGSYDVKPVDAEPIATESKRVSRTDGKVKVAIFEPRHGYDWYTKPDGIGDAFLNNVGKKINLENLELKRDGEVGIVDVDGERVAYKISRVIHWDSAGRSGFYVATAIIPKGEDDFDAVKFFGRDDMTPRKGDKPVEVEYSQTKQDDSSSSKYHEVSQDDNSVSDADRQHFKFLPDEYIPFAKKVENGEEGTLKSEYVPEFFKENGKKYGLVIEDDGLHLVDLDTGETHDEIREREQNLSHRGEYVRQTEDKNWNGRKVEDLDYSQVKANLKFATGSKLQKMKDDAFVYNEKFRKAESARVANELGDAKGIDTLTRAIQEAGHFVEIGGASVPKTLTDALKDAKARLVDLKTSEGGLSGADKNKAFGIDAWPEDDRARRLAQGGVVKVPSSKYDPLWDWFQNHKNDAGIQFLTKPLEGSGANDGSALAKELGIYRDGDTDEETAMRLIDEALGARERYQAWRKDQEEKARTDKRAKAEYDVELLSRGRKYDALARGEKYIEDETQFNLDELERSSKADAEFAAAKAFVENEADENDRAIMKPEHLVKATEEPGTVLRLDHENQTFAIENYDKENGILTLFDPNDTDAPSRRFVVTANDIKEIANDTRTEEDAAGNVPADAQGEGGSVEADRRRGRESDEQDEQGGIADSGDRAARREYAREQGRRYEALFGEKADGSAISDIVAGKPAAAVDFDYDIGQDVADAWSESCRGKKIASLDDAAHLFEELSNPNREVAKILYLSEDGTVLDAVAHVGIIGSCAMDTPPIVRNAPKDTRAVIISHNHPDGNTRPSDARDGMPGDVEVAQHVLEVLNDAGIRLVDSIVTDTDRYHSIANGSDTYPGVPEIAESAKGFLSGVDQTIVQPEDKFNLVGYDRRVDLKKKSISDIAKFLSNEIESIDKDGTYVIGISSGGFIVRMDRLPENQKDYRRIFKGCHRIALLVGKSQIDKAAISREFAKTVEDDVKMRSPGEKDLIGIVYAITRATGEELWNGGVKVDDAFVGRNATMAVNENLDSSKSNTQVETKSDNTKPKVSSKFDAKDFAGDLGVFSDIFKAPVAQLAGGIEGIYSGSQKDYATKKDDRIDNGPALFAVGTGTGGRSFGWGLYGSTTRAVAEDYAGGKDKGTLVQQTWFTNREPGDKTHLLDWSGPLSSANSKRIRGEWRREFGEKLPISVHLTSGGTAYRDLERELGSDVEASMFLNRSDIDGVKTGNVYVAFSADNIRVDHKWKDGEQQYAPVEPVSKTLSAEERMKLVQATMGIVDKMNAKGGGSFEDVARLIAGFNKDVYDKVRPYLSSIYTLATGNRVSEKSEGEIFGKIDTELKETLNGEDTEAAGNRDPGREGEDQSPREGGVEKPGDGIRRDVRGDGDRQSPERASVEPEEPVGRADVGRGDVEQSGDDGRTAGTDVRDVGTERGVGGDGLGGSGTERGDAGAADQGESVGTGGVQDVQPSGSVAEEVTPGFMRYKAPEDLPVKSPSSDSLIVETSALASITPPKIEKKPNIPDEIPESGTLQAHQYHSVCQAVNAHEKFLPDGRRYGYFCADGTGCGKTRIIAGIMLDAVRNLHGRGRCLIVSQKEDLFGDAQKDFAPFGISDKLLMLESSKVGSKSTLVLRGQGIAFTTYGRLADNYQGMDESGRVKFGSKKKGCQFDDIVKWLGGTKPEDYDGVIAFDEAHTASKESGDGEERKQATRAQAVIDLQQKFPKARIVYLTATAAYDAGDLRFLERMGLWGNGTGFDTRNDFVSAFGKNGENVSLMEIMTQGLKARGLYCARSISYKGVKCERIVHHLTDEQKATHDAVRKVLFQIHDRIPQVCAIADVKLAGPNMQFFGQALRFFGSMMTSFKVDTAIKLGKKALADGKCPIFQLIETGASIKDAKSKENGVKARQSSIFGSLPGFGETKTDDENASLKDKIIRFMKTDSCFPTHEPIYDAEGKKIVGWGEEIEEAAQIRDELIGIAKRLPSIGNPIDVLTEAFRGDGVSRVTGETPAAKRGQIVDSFNNGDNRVLIFSGAGGTGSSYHASPKFKNQRQRVQIPIEFGWEPDKFIQALGRSHRNNQVVPPEFWLLTTDLPGEMRFMSTIASRIASMGAIVGGDRNSSGQVVNASDSLDNRYGSNVIRNFGQTVAIGRSYAGVNASTLSGEMMLADKKLRELGPNTFLGRLQLLSFADQKAVFDKISDDISTSIEEAKKVGDYDDGIKKIEAKRTVVKERESMSKDDGAETNRDLITVGEWNDSRRISYGDLAKKTSASRLTFAKNKKSGNLFGFINGEDGVIRQYAPSRGYVGHVEPLDYKANFDPISASEAKVVWDEQYGATPAEEEKTSYFMSGDLFPVWNKIGVDRPQVLRGTPSNARPFIGVRIHESDLFATFYGFGQKDRARKLFADKGYQVLIKGGGTSYPISESKFGQPKLKVISYQGKRVLAVLNPELDGSVASYLAANPNWSEGWYKDPNDALDQGGRICYIPVSNEGAEDAYDGIVGKFGVFKYKGNTIQFASKEPTGRVERTFVPVENEDGFVGAPAINSFAARIGMPNMRIVNNDGIIEFRPGGNEWKKKDDLKRALGGVDKKRMRDGKPYVTYPDGLRLEKNGEDAYYTLPIEKIPYDLREEMFDRQMSPVEPLATSVRDLMKNPDALASRIVFDVMKAGIAPLASSEYDKKSDDELVKIALEGKDFNGAIGALYSRYTTNPSDKKSLDGMIRQIARPYSPKPHEIEDISSAIWIHPSQHGGILTEIRNGNTELFKNGFQKVLWDKARRFTKDFVRNGAKEAQVLVHTDAKKEDAKDDFTERITEANEENFGANTMGLVRVGGVRTEYSETPERDLASILKTLENAGLPDKYLVWMRNYIPAVKEAEADAYVKFADDFRGLHRNPSTKVRRELEARVQRYVKNNTMRKLGKLGERPDKLFEYEFNKMLDGIRTFLATKNPIALPGDMFDSIEWTNEDLVEIMEEMGDQAVGDNRLDEAASYFKMSEVCRLREQGKTGKQIADETGLKEDDVRQVLRRAKTAFGYHYDEGNAGGKQTDWFDILGVPGEITRTEKGASRPKKSKSNLNQADLFVSPKVEITPVEEAVVEPTRQQMIDEIVDEMIEKGNRNLDVIVDTANNVLGDEADEKVIRTLVNAKLAKAGGAEATEADDTFFSKRPDVGMTAGQERSAKLSILDEDRKMTDEEISNKVVREFRLGKSLREGVNLAQKLGATKDKAKYIANNAWFKAKKLGPYQAVQETMFAPVEPLALPDNLGFANDAVDAQRKILGLPKLNRKHPVTKDEDVIRKAEALLRNERDFESKIAVWGNGNYPISHVEQVALGEYIIRKELDAEIIRNKQSAAYANGDLILAASMDEMLNDIYAKINTADEVNAKIGTEAGRALRARRFLFDKDMTFAGYISSCMEANGGPLTKEFREMAERLWNVYEANKVTLNESRMKDIEAKLEAVMQQWLNKTASEDKAHRLGTPGAEKIERDFENAITTLTYWAQKTGGVLQAIPNGQKLIRAIERHHLVVGDGMTDGKPDAAKMIGLLVDDLKACGFDTDAWEIRQMESRMGNAIEPSKVEIEKSVRDLHRQMLIGQQIEYILKYGELPPKTGFITDEDSELARELRRLREKVIRENGLNAKDEAGRIASALKALKTRIRNKNENVLKKIEILKAGGTLPEETKPGKITPDAELAQLQAEYEENKRILADLDDPDGSEAIEKNVVKALRRLQDRKADLEQQLADAKADPEGYAWDTPEKADEDPRIVAAKAEIDSLKREIKSVKDSVFPFGTEKELEKYYARRAESLTNAYDKWNTALKVADSETTWQGKWDALHPTKRRVFPKTAEILAQEARTRQAYEAVIDYRRKLEREDTRGENVLQWIRFLNSAPAMLRTMLDLSAAGVQGARALASNPILWLKAVADGIKSFVSENKTAVLVEDLRNHPYFEDFKKHGGHVYYMDGIDGEMPEDFRVLDGGMDFFGHKLRLDKIPGVKRSSRSFSGFLNRLNLELYRSIVEASGADGTGVNNNVRSDIAQFINGSTGYGYKDARREKTFLRNVALVLDAIAWAPRKAIGEIKYFTGLSLVEPWLGSRKSKKTTGDILKAQKAIGRQYGRFLLGVLAFNVAMYIHNLLSNQDDKNPNRLSDILDPRSSDFMNWKIGNTRIDGLFGGSTIYRTLARLITGKTKVNGVVKDSDFSDEIKKFLRGKATPALSTFVDIKTGSNTFGKPVDYSVGSLIQDYALPITTSAEIENFAKNDPLTAVIIAPLAFIGMTKYTAEEDILERAKAQVDDAGRMMNSAADVYDTEMPKSIGEKIRARSDAFGPVESVLAMERDVEKNEKEIKTLRSALKGTPDMRRRDKINARISALERTNDRIGEKLPDLRKKAEEKARKYKWDSVDRW